MSLVIEQVCNDRERYEHPLHIQYGIVYTLEAFVEYPNIFVHLGISRRL